MSLILQTSPDPGTDDPENPGTDDPALPLPTSPSVPSSDTPKRNRATKREQAQAMEARAHA